MTDADLIREAVRVSGLSARVFAEEIVWRDERTLRRWQAGRAIPPRVSDKLRWYLRLSPEQRETYVDAATARPA